MIPEDFILLKQASEFTAFNEKLSLLIKTDLNPSWSMVDFGCGFGLLDFKLAPFVNSITAIDSNEMVLAEVEKEIDNELYKGNDSARKIQTLKADTRELSDDMTWDIALLNFYNVPYEELADLIDKAKERAIVIVDGKSSNSRFHSSSENRNHYTAPELEKFFIEKGYNFKKNIVEMQFGYPFKNLQAIQQFLDQLLTGDNYKSKEFISDENEKLVASAEERIIKTNRYDYPYYLPKNVSIGIFVITK